MGVFLCYQLIANLASKLHPQILMVHSNQMRSNIFSKCKLCVTRCFDVRLCASENISAIPKGLLNTMMQQSIRVTQSLLMLLIIRKVGRTIRFNFSFRQTKKQKPNSQCQPPGSQQMHLWYNLKSLCCLIVQLLRVQATHPSGEVTTIPHQPYTADE